MKINFNCLIVVSFILSAACISCSNRKIAKRIKADVITNVDTFATTTQITDTTVVYDSVKMFFVDKLAVPADSIYDLKLFGFIKDNLGVKCAAKKKGVNSCESFMAEVLGNVYGIDFPTTPSEQIKNNKLELFKDKSYLQKGDLIFFNNNFNQPDKISHSGLYLFNGFFLTATNIDGVVLRALTDKYWSSHFVAVGRFKADVTAQESQ